MALMKSLLSVGGAFFFFSCLIGKTFYVLHMLDPDVDFSVTSFSKYDVVGNSSENLIWIVQVSDLHLSIFNDQSRITDFSEFCNFTLDFIKPSVVLATGDLTDAVTVDGYGSRQVEGEWIHYRDILDNNRIPQKLLWLDIRGNHDNFNVLNINADESYYRKYTVQGKNHPRSYLYEYKMKNGEIISFVGVDACLETGLRRPFNFIGTLYDSELRTLKSFADGINNGNATYAVWFGHYPTSTILSPGSEVLRSLITSTNNKSIAYVSGHLHMLGGLVPNMYAYQNGFFELELGDWRSNRVFRIMSIDHGEFGFIDVHHRDLPYVLVTHPKRALLASSISKPDIYIQKSKYIRLLVFSPAKVISVKIKIDEGEWQYCDYVEGPIYVLYWNASEYRKGLHDIKVEVNDADGHVKLVTHTFSLDGTRVEFKWLSKFFLIPSVSHTFQNMFYCLVYMSTIPLVFFRLTDVLIRKEWISNPDFNFKYGPSWIRRFWILSNINCLFYSLLIYPIYLTVGPWAIAELLDGKFGVIFPWGIVINDSYIAASPSYIIGFFQMLVFHIPLLLILACYLDRRSIRIVYNIPCSYTMKKKLIFAVWDNLFFILLVLVQSLEVYHLWISYGSFTMLFCPLKSWWLLLALWLRRTIITMPKDTILKAAEIWIPSRFNRNL